MILNESIYLVDEKNEDLHDMAVENIMENKSPSESHVE